MAKLYEMNTEAEFWVASLPPVEREVAMRCPPNLLYRIKATGKRGNIYSYSHDGTVTMNVTGEYNRVLFGQRVFVLKPDDIEECDLPLPTEELGDVAQEAGYTEEDIRTILIPAIIARKNE